MMVWKGEIGSNDNFFVFVSRGNSHIILQRLLETASNLSGHTGFSATNSNRLPFEYASGAGLLFFFNFSIADSMLGYEMGFAD
jgi:hypothetical protein